ncbi:MAG: patatin-like phospholipase family protein [Gammaproteobacteria bacterium]
MSNVPHIAPEEENKRALILPGGGMRVAYQAGVIQRLHEHGLRFSYADGTSGGLMNLASLLSGIHPDKLVSRWRSLRPTGFISLLSFRKYLKFPNLPSFGDFDGITEKIFPHLGIDVDKIKSSQGVRAQFNVCDFTAKLVKPVPHNEIELPLLLAGMSLPIFTPAVDHANKKWTDAVWIQDSNILRTVEHGANEIWVAWCIGNTAEFKPGFLNQYVHMIEMSAIGALNHELEVISQLNQRIEAGETPFGHTKPITVHLIKPALPIPLDPDYISAKVSGDALVDQGYMDTSVYLSSYSDQGIPLNEHATQTPVPASGISFSEVMRGRITWGEKDPLTGWQNVNGIPVALHATINIRDIDGFVSDKHHCGGMVAHLISPRLGFTLAATATNFQLFSPTTGGDCVEMVYEMGFMRDDGEYWFSGRKHVCKGSIFRMWKETTTLHVTLHKGNSRNGEIVAAGMLRLSVNDLISLLTTFHSRDCIGLRASFLATKTFVSFFVKSLWQSYGYGLGKSKKML